MYVWCNIFAPHIKDSNCAAKPDVQQLPNGMWFNHNFQWNNDNNIHNCSIWVYSHVVTMMTQQNSLTVFEIFM